MSLDCTVSMDEIRRLFADVEPVPQDDGPDPVVPISYTNEFVEVMDLFRAVLRGGKLSERALLLSEHVIRVNSANYTAWYFRRKALEACSADWESELDFCSKVSEVCPKNYQLWYHRREVVSKIKDPSKELEHCANVLFEDPKNYHAWSHRQWVLSTFGIWGNELDYVHSLLKEDPRNNSAWNQRWFVFSNFVGWSAEVISREIEYSFRHIISLPQNESPWNYVIGLMEQDEFNETTVGKVVSFAKTILKTNADCEYAASALVDALESRSSADAIQEAIQMTIALGDSIDTIRKEYWKWRRDCLSQTLSEEPSRRIFNLNN